MSSDLLAQESDQPQPHLAELEAGPVRWRESYRRMLGAYTLHDGSYLLTGLGSGNRRLTWKLARTICMQRAAVIIGTLPLASNPQAWLGRLYALSVLVLLYALLIVSEWRQLSNAPRLRVFSESLEGRRGSTLALVVPIIFFVSVGDVIVSEIALAIHASENLARALACIALALLSAAVTYALFPRREWNSL